MSSPRRSQLTRRTETQALVLQKATELFGEKGYAQTSLEDIAQSCELTIRPIYHYFGNKKSLFQAVNEKLEQELSDAMEMSMANASSVSIRAGWMAFLQISNNKNFRQIVLVDSPNILGRERWANNVVILKARKLLAVLQPAMSLEKSELITRMIIAALAEAALMSAEMENSEELMQELGDLMEGLLTLVSKGGKNG